jgi:hypothetical protein
VPDEPALKRAAEKLAKRGIDHVLIDEPDSPWDGQATAIGVTPTSDRRKVRRVLADLKKL